MSDDFEVMPVGTIAECMAMRKFANELMQIIDQCDKEADVLRNLIAKVREIREFYEWHTQSYPLNP